MLQDSTNQQWVSRQTGSRLGQIRVQFKLSRFWKSFGSLRKKGVKSVHQNHKTPQSLLPLFLIKANYDNNNNNIPPRTVQKPDSNSSPFQTRTFHTADEHHMRQMVQNGEQLPTEYPQCVPRPHKTFVAC